MKKRYILILSIIFVILSISCVSAVDNDTDVFKEQNNNAIPINEQNRDVLSLSSNETVFMSVDSSGSDSTSNQKSINEENDYEITIENSEEDKEPIKITTKKYYTTDQRYAILKAVLTDPDCFDVNEGIVKFTVDGKSYDVKVHDNVATMKIKLDKPKTYTYTATYMGTDYYQTSKTSSSKIYVYSTSKNARTFKIKGYKFTLTDNQYAKLINAKNTGKSVYYKIKTNKIIKQKFKKYSYKWKYDSTVLLETAHRLVDKYPWLYKYGSIKKHWISDAEYYYTAKLYKEVEIVSYKTKNSRVYAYISYVLNGQLGKDKYGVEIMTDNYPVVKGKLHWLVKSSTILGLKTAKAKDMKNFSMK